MDRNKLIIWDWVLVSMVFVAKWVLIGIVAYAIVKFCEQQGFV